ncbi:MAG TPA: ABC transporter substrate-binding protein [Solirubrobacterales bacterium]|nr:ABC transporter substrate-binding protein [Solirubrobacterales bacterium]
MQRHRSSLALVAALAAVVGLGLLLAGCGGGGSDDNTLRWFIFNEPGGGPQQAARQCSQQSNGRYQIEFDFLPADADGQREQLVRRLGAEDSTIDIIGMDVIWTGEFANAGWIEEWTGQQADAVSQGVFDSVLETARYEGRLYAAPIWTNTQLLWYRSDRVDQPPETWDEMIEEGVRLEENGEGGRIQVQADRYEGLVVWANALIASAGTEILSGPEQIDLAEGPTEDALAIMGRIARSPAAAPDISTSDEDSGRLAFQDGGSAFMVNYPFVHPSAKEEAPNVFKNMDAAPYPRVEAGRQSAPPLGGINLAVSSFSDNKELAFEAIECLIQPENQIAIAEAGGLPPVLEELYDRPVIEEIYPGFVEILREAIETAVPRPSQSPAYQDLSLAIQRSLHPPADIDPEDPAPTYDRLRDYVQQAVDVEGLL